MLGGHMNLSTWSEKDGVLLKNLRESAGLDISVQARRLIYKWRYENVSHVPLAAKAILNLAMILKYQKKPVRAFTALTQAAIFTSLDLECHARALNVFG